MAKRITGHELYPWQRYVLDVALEVLPDGGWAYEEVLVTVPRQSGKSFMFAPLVGERLSRKPDRQAWITAQNGDKAKARWLAASKPLEMLPQVRKLVSTAHERTLWQNGSAFRPFTPKEGAIDGETPDLVLIDELWAFNALDREVMEDSFGPAVFMNPWGQLWKTSTAGTERSSWLNADRERGRRTVEAGGGRFAFFEWSIPEAVDGMDSGLLPDEDLVRLVLAHHPLAGRHPKIESHLLMEELGKGRARFLRGLGNLTRETREDGAIPADVWRRGESRAMIPTDARVGIGVDVDELGRESTIYVGYRDPSGLGVVEIVERAAGQGWVPGRLKGLTERWDVGAVAVAYAGPSRSVGDTAERLGVDILRVWTPDVGAATTRFIDDLEQRRQSHDELRDTSIGDAMRAAQLRRLKTGPVIDPKGVEPVTALRAAVMAMWAADHLPEIPVRIPFHIA